MNFGDNGNVSIVSSVVTSAIVVQDFVGGCVWEGLGGIWENTVHSAQLYYKCKTAVGKVIQ